MNEEILTALNELIALQKSSQSGHITPESIPDQEIRLVIPAGQMRKIQGIADSFFVSEATGPVWIVSRVLPPREFEKGEGKHLPAPAQFRGLEVHNQNDYEITVDIDYSYGEMIDKRLIVASGRGAALGTYPVQTSIVADLALAGGTLADDGVRIYLSTPPAGMLWRYSVSWYNASISDRLEILDVDDNIIGYVPAGQVIEEITSDTIKLRNKSGSAVDVKGFEKWVINPFIL